MYLRTIFLSILIASYKSQENRNKDSVLYESSTSENFQTKYDEAIELINQNKTQEALSILTQITEEDSNFVQAQFQLGKMYLRMERYEDAELYLTKSVEGKEDFADAYFALGNVQYYLKKVEQAILTFEKFLELDPQSAEGYHNYAATLRDMGKLEESIPHFKKSIELNNKFAKAFLNLGITLNNLDKREESIKYLKQAIVLDDTQDDGYFFLGIVYHKQNQFKKAIKTFKKAIKLNPTNKQAHFKLANCLLEIDDFDMAQHHLDTALNIDNNFILALISRGLLQNQLEESGNPYEDLQRAQVLMKNQTLIKEQNIPEAKIAQLWDMFDNLSPDDQKKIRYNPQQRKVDDL